MSTADAHVLGVHAEPKFGYPRSRAAGTSGVSMDLERTELDLLRKELSQSRPHSHDSAKAYDALPSSRRPQHVRVRARGFQSSAVINKGEGNDRQDVTRRSPSSNTGTHRPKADDREVLIALQRLPTTSARALRWGAAPSSSSGETARLARSIAFRARRAATQEHAVLSSGSESGQGSRLDRMFALGLERDKLIREQAE